MERYQDTTLSPEVRASDLLSKLSLAEKMAQVNCIFPWTDDPLEKQAECEHGIGQVGCLLLRDFKTLEEAATWQRAVQEMVMANSEHHIPAVFHMEGLCGAYLQGAMSFPSGISRGSTFDPALEEQVGRIVARQELSAGISQVLAPVLDISRDSRLGRQGETYGEDPTLASAMGAAYVKGIQNTTVDGRNAESEAKHFLGFHASMAGIHGANVELGERQLKEVYAKPFQAAITESSLRGAMPCYCSVNGEPISSSHKLLTEWLRDDMGFDGVVGADYSAIDNVYESQHLYESKAETGYACLSAGLDIEQPERVCYNEELEKQFENGDVDMAILDTAVLRVLTAKFRMGLFEHPFALQGEELQKAFFAEEDEAISLRSALESIVLLKNDHDVLPLKNTCKKIAVIGAQAQNARIFFGGYTHESMVEAIHAVANSIAGVESGEREAKPMLCVPGTGIQSDETDEFDAILKHQKPDCRSLLEQLEMDLPDTEISYSYGYAIAGDDTSHFKEALEACEGADVILLTLGGKHGSCSVASMGEGVDATDINLPKCQDDFILEASKLGIPMVGIHFNGRPISSDIADEHLDAILEAWSPAEMGAPALSMVLRGEVAPSGKLPVSVARNAGQIPIFYNHDNGSAWHQGFSIGFPNYVDCPHMPRYCFGHGLSYTTFEYKNLKIDNKTLSAEDTAKVSVDVSNTGSRKGTEVVQLYFRDEQASCIRPVKELAGFARVELDPGETKTVTFHMPVTQTAFVGRDMKWIVEKGEMTLMVGSSSEEIRLQDKVTISETKKIDEKTRGFYAKVEIA